ncbi:MAG: DUF4252 domain-containing protein [Saprospiraceae bacterium]|nr:DUF4252 domain-containing protein [Saprospiraceae bacterium]
MKQLLLSFAAMLLFCVFLPAQTSGLQDFANRHKNDPKFTFAFVSKDLLETATHEKVEDKDWKQLQNVVKNIGSLTILAADETREAPSLYREALDLVPGDMDELLSVRDNDDKVRIWVREDQSTLTDLVLLVGSADEFVLVFFNGQLELGNFADLARLLDADQAQDLARTAQSVSIEFQVSPNPSAGDITLRYAADPGDAPTQLTISDVNGRQISVLNLNGESEQTLHLAGLSDGLYWLQLKTRQGKTGVKSLQIATR